MAGERTQTASGRRSESTLTPLRAVILVMRVTMETGIVAALAYWGYTLGGSVAAKVLLAVAAPVVGFGIWGVVDFRRAGRAAELLRLAEELLISGLAAAALIAAGQPVPGWILAALSVTYHAAVYLTGGRLLKQH